MGTSGEQLRNEISMRPGMSTFAVNGRFDLCTEFSMVFHVLDNTGLSGERVCAKGYHFCHMVCIGEENVHELCADIRKFIFRKDPMK